jgi:hypothetical protein
VGPARIVCQQGQHRLDDEPPGNLAAVFAKTLAPYVRDPDIMPADSGVNRLRPILDRVQAGGGRIVVFFPPMHATRHELVFRSARRRRLADACTRELVKCVADLNARRRDSPPIEVWDFRGFTGYHAESIPDPASRRPMRWYLDALHFREALGEIVVSRILERAVSPAEFGVILTPSNVDKHLATLGRSRDAYVRRHPEQLQIIEAAERMVQ